MIGPHPVMDAFAPRDPVLVAPCESVKGSMMHHLTSNRLPLTVGGKLYEPLLRSPLASSILRGFARRGCRRATAGLGETAAGLGPAAPVCSTERIGGCRPGFRSRGMAGDRPPARPQPTPFAPLLVCGLR